MHFAGDQHSSCSTAAVVSAAGVEDVQTEGGEHVVSAALQESELRKQNIHLFSFQFN